MNDAHDPSTDDRERMKRYLEWRERTERVPRRRWPQRAAVVGVALGGIALVAWLTLVPRAVHDSASTSGPGSPWSALPNEVSGPAAIERAQAPRPAPARRMARSAARHEAPPPRAPESRTDTSELAGEAATVRTEPTATPPPVHSTPDVIAPSTATPAAVDARPACAAVTAPDGGVRARSQRAVECVGGWLKGEVQEARDGVRREIDDVRAGVDRLGRGLQSLGGKLRRSE